jgi:pilus assembly protein CpaE
MKGYKMPEQNGATPLVAIVEPGSTHEQITDVLSAQDEFQPVVILETMNGWVKEVRDARPEIILIDAVLEGQSTLEVIDDISLKFPDAAIVAILPNDKPLNAQKAMLAGARAFIIQPFTGIALLSSLRRVRDLEERRRYSLSATGGGEMTKSEPMQILTVFSPRGGVGCSTVAINMALAIHGHVESRVLLMEGKLLFGHLALMLNIRAHNDITDLIPHANLLDENLVKDVVVKHASGIDVLLSPNDVQAGQGVRPEDLLNIVRGIRQMYDFIIIDAGSHLDENTVTLMDLSDRILLLTTPDLASLHDVSRFVQISRTLSYPTGKMLTILNRSGMMGGVKTKEIEAALHHEIFAHIPEDEPKVVRSLNRGVPHLYKYPRSPVSRSIRHIAKNIVEMSVGSVSEAKKAISLMPKLKSRIATTRVG